MDNDTRELIRRSGRYPWGASEQDKADLDILTWEQTPESRLAKKKEIVEALKKFETMLTSQRNFCGTYAANRCRAIIEDIDVSFDITHADANDQQKGE